MRLLLGLLFLLALTSYSSATYCLCIDGVGEKKLQASIDYACGVLGDCNPIQEKGPCYQPNDVKSHCDWAVNTYYQRFRFEQVSGSCNFSGTATTSPNPPSTVVTGCIYPSSPGNAGTTPTTGAPGTPTTGAPGTPTTGVPVTPTFEAPGTPTIGAPGTPTFPGPPAFGPTGVFDPSGNEALSLFTSIALTLGFSVIALL